MMRLLPAIAITAALAAIAMAALIVQNATQWAVNATSSPVKKYAGPSLSVIGVCGQRTGSAGFYIAENGPNVTTLTVFASGGTATDYPQVLAVCNHASFTLSVQLVAVGVVSAQNAELINQLTIYQSDNPSNAVSFSGTSTTSASTSPITLGPDECAYFGVYVSAAPVSAAAQGPTYQVNVIATASGLALTNVVFVTPYVNTSIMPFSGDLYNDAYWMGNGTLYLTQPRGSRNGGVYVQFNWPSDALGLLVNVTFGYTTGTPTPADGVIITAFAGTGSWCTPSDAGARYLPYGGLDTVPCGEPLQWFAQFNPWDGSAGGGDGSFEVAVFNNQNGKGDVSSSLGWSFSPNTYMVASAYYNATTNYLYLYWHNPLHGVKTAYADLHKIFGKWKTPKPGDYILAIAGATGGAYADWKAYCISYTVVTDPSQIPPWATEDGLRITAQDVTALNSLGEETVTNTTQIITTTSTPQK